MLNLDEMLCIATLMIVAGAIVGLLIGVWIGHHTSHGNGKPLGKLFIERIDVEPYVTGCWLGIENQDDIKKLKRDGQIVTFVVQLERGNEPKSTLYYKNSAE